MENKPRIYVAGPYSVGDHQENVNHAIDIGNQLMDMGFVPFVPHMSHYLHQRKERDYEHWMAFDLEWLKLCDAIYRMDGKSSGADREVQYAESVNMPVFYDMTAVEKYYKKNE